MKINSITARQLLDCKARPLVEVEVITDAGLVTRGAAPTGSTVGVHEAYVTDEHRLGDSIALLRAAAGAAGQPAYEYVNRMLGLPAITSVPVPSFNLINGVNPPGDRAEHPGFRLLEEYLGATPRVTVSGSRSSTFFSGPRSGIPDCRLADVAAIARF